MKTRWLRLVIALAIALIALGVGIGLGSRLLAQTSDSSSVAPAAPSEAVVDAAEAQAPGAGKDPLILSYPAKFVCQEPLQPGTFYYGTVAPLVKEQTGILIHNSQPYTLTFYKKAVQAPTENPLTTAQGVAPGKWVTVTLAPDRAFRINCDDIARLLTGNPAATFIGTYGIGVEVEGFVVIAVGPQPVSNRVTFGSLDVTAEYSRGSEVLKKDIDYQPWWWWWWWQLPWRLGYPYQRILTIDPAQNIDCRGTLYTALQQDAQQLSDPQRQLTQAALSEGAKIDPTSVTGQSGTSLPALVALVGRCDKVDRTTMSVDYVLVSNKALTDPDPRVGGNRLAYPWIAGHWYDLTVVMPQNVSKDLDDYLRKWNTQRWIDANTPSITNTTAIQSAMAYYFPYWCGWGYWWWWWNGGDCTDIGVGEGESLDVEQVVPTRVFMSVWPPR